MSKSEAGGSVPANFSSEELSLPKLVVPKARPKAFDRDDSDSKEDKDEAADRIEDPPVSSRPSTYAHALPGMRTSDLPPPLKGIRKHTPSNDSAGRTESPRIHVSRNAKRPPPSFYSRIVGSAPCVTYLLLWVLILAPSVWMIIFEGFSFTIPQLVNSEPDSKADIRVLHSNFLRATRGGLQENSAGFRSFPQNSVDSDDFRIHVIFYPKTESGILLTSEGLQTIASVHKKIISQPLFQDLCYKPNDESSCLNASKSFSNSFTESEVQSLTSSGIIDRLIFLYLRDDIDINYFFDKDFYDLTKSGLVPKYARSIYSIGLPFPGFNSPFDRIDEQREIFQQFLEGFAKDLIDDTKDNKIQVLVGGKEVTDYLSVSISLGDFLWLIGSFGSVALFQLLYTGSFFITANGLLIILCSMPFAYVVHFYVFAIDIFETSHFILLFFILGSSSTRQFLVFSYWKISAHELAMPHHRVNVPACVGQTLQRSFRAVVTAFFSQASVFIGLAIFSSVPLLSFAIYALLLLVVLQLLEISLYLAVVVINDTVLYVFNPLWLYRICSSDVVETSQLQPVEKNFDAHQEPSVTASVLQQVVMRHLAAVKARANAAYSVDSKDVSFTAKVVRGCKTVSVLFVGSVLWAAILFVAIYLSITLDYKQSTQGRFVDSSAIELAQKLLKSPSVFHPTSKDSPPAINFFWGIKGLDESGSSDSIWKQRVSGKLGTPILDSSFDISSFEHQNYVLDVCRRLQDVSESFVYADNKDSSVSCFIDKFALWVNSTSSLNLTFPLPSSRFEEILKLWVSSTEEGLEAVSKGNLLFGPESDGFPLKSFVLSIDLPESSIEKDKNTQLKYWNVWQSRLEDYQVTAPNGLTQSYQEAGILWTWQAVFSKFVLHMWLMLAVWLGITFVGTIIFSLPQILLSACVVFTSASAVICILATTKVFNIAIGEDEIILIAVGAAICAILPAILAAEYSHRSEQVRSERLSSAFKQVGWCMGFGALCSLSSSLFLYGTNFKIFRNGAWLLGEASLLSFAWSFLGMSLILYYLMPFYNHGTIMEALLLLKCQCFTPRPRFPKARKSTVRKRMPTL